MKKFDIFSRFDTIYKCDRIKGWDRQTDGRTGQRLVPRMHSVAR